jgi:hypothetical protein
MITLTQNALNALGGKPVVAGEYNEDDKVSGYENISKKLGNAAVCQQVVGPTGTCSTNPTPCVAGFGNGAVSSNVKYPTCSGGPVPSPTPGTSPSPGVSPTPSGNVAPVTQDFTVFATSGQPKNIQLVFEDPDGPGPYVYTVQQPSFGTVVGSTSDNDWIYTSNPGFTGNDSFRWRVNDGLINSNISTVTVIVDSSGSPTPTPSVSPSATPGFAKGDVNHDNQVNATDMKLTLSNYLQSPSQVSGYFDPVGDTKVNIHDAAWVVRDW